MYTFKIGYQRLHRKYRSTANAMYSKQLKELDVYQLQNVIAYVIINFVIKPNYDASKELLSSKKIAVYFSMEFLEGRIVLDALLNSGIKEKTRSIFADEGVDINILEEVEDTALGNGGLGRLAACFMESAATTGYPVFGFGLYYKYGLFKQQFDGFDQVELPDDWAAHGDPWFNPDEDNAVIINYKNTRVKAVPYVLPIIGYGDSRTANVFPLTLWKAVPIEGETNDVAKGISDFLYPGNNELRIYQEYFFVSATLQFLFKRHWEKHHTLDNLEDYYVFQMNDTHPVMSCVEYVRLLQEYGYTFEEAYHKAKKCFAYTNHTVMPEALESWEENLFKSVVPDKVFEVIQALNQRLIDSLIGRDDFQYVINGKREVNWEKVHRYELIYYRDEDRSKERLVHMWRIASYMGFKINGVAVIHSNLLKETILRDWANLYPEKFTNATNGITPRRWIRGCNPELSAFLDSKIGPSWTVNLENLEMLEAFADDPATLDEFAATKAGPKERLAKYIKAHEDIEISPTSIFDCQVKRIHQYKRQLMNVFRILYLYDMLKKGVITDWYEVTFIIGGKAAASYKEAKLILKLAKDVANMVNNDPDMNGKMKVVVLTNFNVSYGEFVYPAADFSEQISTVGTEASGTGNMKFMTNGAVTIGTPDGANIEIDHAAGFGNNYMFGPSVDELRKVHYNPSEFMDNSNEMQTILPYLTGKGKLTKDYTDLINDLRWHDDFFVMYDLKAYIDTSMIAFSDFAKEKRTGDHRYYTKKAFQNLIHSGFFSSDRTIREYARGIWHISRVRNITQ